MNFNEESTPGNHFQSVVVQRKHPGLWRLGASEMSHLQAWHRFSYLGEFISHLLDWIDFTLQSGGEAAGKRNEATRKTSYLYTQPTLPGGFLINGA